MSEKRVISFHSVQYSKHTPKKSVQMKKAKTMSFQNNMDSRTILFDYSKTRFNIPLADKNVSSIKVFPIESQPLKQVPQNHGPNLKNPSLISNRYELKEKIGEGTFSRIFSAFDWISNCAVALKILKNSDNQSSQEIEILKYLASAFVSGNMSCELIDTFFHRNQRVLVFPRYHRNLASCIVSRKLSTREILAISTQILHGLSQIHSTGIIHRDVKPDNIMFATKNSNKIKLIDYGLACFKKDSLHSYVQSRFYRAPEVILGYSYTCAIDMWSFGCILAEMFTGAVLFRCSNEDDLYHLMIEKIGQPPPSFVKNAPRQIKVKRKLRYKSIFEENIDNREVLEVLESCLTWDPAKRITASQALNKFLKIKAPNPRRKSMA